MTRRRLPNRRDADVLNIEFNGAVYTLSIGRYPNGKPGEIFLRSGKPGSQIDDLLADAAVAISVALQCGVPPAALAGSLGRSAMKRASVLGLALDLLAEASP